MPFIVVSIARRSGDHDGLRPIARVFSLAVAFFSGHDVPGASLGVVLTHLLKDRQAIGRRSGGGLCRDGRYRKKSNTRQPQWEPHGEQHRAGPPAFSGTRVYLQECDERVGLALDIWV